MTRRLGVALAAVLLLVGAYGAYRVVLHVRAPVIPAIVTREMNAHRALGRDVPAAELTRALANDALARMRRLAG